MDFSSAVFSWREWTVTVRGTTAYGLPTALAWRVNFRVAVSTGNYVYDSISGPKHRIDISFSAAGGGSARFMSHGIVGQSLNDAAPRYGRTDNYPSSGEFTTSAMAEGAIEGEAAQYEVSSPHATDYFFSRFDRSRLWVGPSSATATEATAVEAVAGQEAREGTAGRFLSEAPCPPPSPPLANTVSLTQVIDGDCSDVTPVSARFTLITFALARA